MDTILEGEGVLPGEEDLDRPGEGMRTEGDLTNQRSESVPRVQIAWSMRLLGPVLLVQLESEAECGVYPAHHLATVRVVIVVVSLKTNKTRLKHAGQLLNNSNKLGMCRSQVEIFDILDIKILNSL